MGIDLSKANEKFKSRLQQDAYDFRAVPAKASQPTGAKALVSGHERKKESERGMAIRITFISLRRRLLDPDAIAVSTKYLQDAVCESLGIDDGDRRISFQYEQIKTTGPTGVIVKIDL